MLTGLTFVHDQENSECICYRVERGNESYLRREVRADNDYRQMNLAVGTVDLRRTMNDGIGCVSETNEIDAVFLAVQRFLRSETRDATNEIRPMPNEQDTYEPA